MKGSVPTKLLSLQNQPQAQGFPGYQHFWTIGCKLKGFYDPVRFDNSPEWLTEFRKMLCLWFYYKRYELGSAQRRCIGQGLGGSWIWTFFVLRMYYSPGISMYISNQEAHLSLMSRVFTEVLLHRHDWLAMWLKQVSKPLPPGKSADITWFKALTL